MSREPSYKPSVGAQCAKWAVRLLKLLLVLLCIFILLSAMASDVYMFELPYHLLAGWAYYLARSVPQITPNVDLLLSSLIALSFATWGLHRLAAWCWSGPKAATVPILRRDIGGEEGARSTAGEEPQQPEKKPWQLRWTLAITTMLLLLFASANAGAGAWIGLG